MPITAQLHDGTPLEFPDGTDPAVIQATVKKVLHQRIASKIDQDPISQGAREAQKTTIPEELARQTLMTGRYGLEGVGLGGVANKIGLPQPQGAMENVIGDTARTMATGGGIGSVARQLESKVVPAVQPYMQMFGANPGATTVASAGSGAATGAAKEGGAGPVGQFFAGLGGAMAPAGAVAGAQGAANLFRNVTDPTFVAGKAALKAGGDKVDQIIALLRRDKQLVEGSAPTTGEAAAPAGSAEFSALQEGVKGRLPSQFSQRADEQNLARLAAVSGVAKDKTAFDAATANRSANAEQNYGAVRNDLIDPRSESQIMQDAINAKGSAASQSVDDVRRLETAKQLADKAAQNWFPVSGQPRAPGRYSYPEELAGIAERKSGEAAASSLQSGAERRYLEDFKRMLAEAGDLNTTALSSFLSRPSVQDAVQKAFLAAKEKPGTYFPKEGEPFSVGNLQRIKMAIADELEKPEAVKALGKTERKEIGDTLGSFVKWLSDKSPGWKNARTQFAEDSVPINRMQIGQYLEGVLKPPGWQAGAGGQPLNVKGFIDALRKGTDVADTTAARRAADVVQKGAMGGPRYADLPEAMGPEMGPLNSVMSDLLRSQAHQGLAKTGSKAASQILGTDVPQIPPTGMFSPILSVGRGIANRVLGKVQDKSADELAKAMLNPQEMAKLMEKATPQQAKLIAELLRSSTSGMTASTLEGMP